MVINHSFEMFRSVIGTWLPFALIFAATFAVGTVLRRSREGPSTSAKQDPTGSDPGN